jgi:sulfite reductase (NADPH) flavoprotein alpha-component
MAVHDHSARLEVVGKEGGMSAETAAEYLKELNSNGRYQRDVY